MCKRENGQYGINGCDDENQNAENAVTSSKIKLALKDFLNIAMTDTRFISDFFNYSLAFRMVGGWFTPDFFINVNEKRN